MALNFDSYRMEHESEVEWGLRKKFLEAHADKFEGNTNRLLCMASCFINIEMYGCRYPNEVMIEMKGLIEEIYDDIQEFRTAVRERTEVKFVKASDSAEPASKPSGKQPLNLPNKQKPLKYGNFIKSSPSNDTSEPSPSVGSSSQRVGGPPASSSTIAPSAPAGPSVPNPQSQERQETFQRLGLELEKALRKSENSVCALHLACQRVNNLNVTTQFDLTEGGQHVCHLHIDSVCVASGRPRPQKKESRKDAYENAVIALRNPHLLFEAETVPVASDLPIDRSESDVPAGPSVRGADDRMTHPNKKTVKRVVSGGRGQKRKYSYQEAAQEGHDLFNNFYLLEQLQSNNDNAVGILNQSSGFSKANIEWEYANENGKVRCMLTFRGPGLPVGNAVEDTKLAARKAAAEQALAYLRQHCWTIQIKQTADCAGSEVAINRGEIMGNEAAANVQLPESNVGSKLMKLMGWSGGGIGKNEQGIKEPISVSTVINRSGLGRDAAQGMKKSFIPQIVNTLQNYARSDSETDLMFNSEFTKDERAAIHKQCQRLNLKSHSHGKGDDRYLIVSRKRSANQLFQRLQREGGESDKYRLIPPGERVEEEEDDYYGE